MPKTKLSSSEATGSRVGTWLAVGFLIVIVVGLCIPTSHKNREPLDRTLCKNNLRQLAIACMLYAESNGGQMPTTWGSLYSESFIENRRFLKCPKDKSKAASSYTLVPGLRSDMPGDFLLAYETCLHNHDSELRSVLFLNHGCSAWRPGQEAEFQQRLADQAEKVRNWKPAAEDNSAVQQEAKP